MPTAGQRVAQEGFHGLGWVEDPFGSNSDGGGPIDKLEAFWHLHGLAWCAMYVSWCYRAAGVDDAGIISPSTAVMCARADQKGLWLAAGRPVPAGAILILCGIHTEIAIADRGNGLIDAIGGNVNQGVRRTVRSLTGGWRCIVPPAIGEGEAAPLEVYGFDDVGLAPKRYGGWRAKADRERVIAKLAPEEQRLVRRINVGGASPYAFEILSHEAWRFGPWDDRTTRDSIMARRAAATHRRMRPWADAIAAGHEGLTTGETTT